MRLHVFVYHSASFRVCEATKVRDEWVLAKGRSLVYGLNRVLLCHTDAAGMIMCFLQQR